MDVTVNHLKVRQAPEIEQLGPRLVEVLAPKPEERYAAVNFGSFPYTAGLATAPSLQAPSGSARMLQPLGDMLSLTTTQRTTAWNDLQKQAAEQKAPSTFKPIVGSAVPSAIKIEPVPSKAPSDVSPLKSYDYAMTQGKLLLVNPSDKKVAAVLSETTGS